MRGKVFCLSSTRSLEPANLCPFKISSKCHTKCSQSSRFIPSLSLLSLTVKQPVSHFIADKELYQGSFYTLSLYFSTQFTLKKIIPLARI